MAQTKAEKPLIAEEPPIYAYAGDEGFEFILPPIEELADGKTLQEHSKGGLIRQRGQGHFVTIVGKGGTGKSILALQLIVKLLEDAELRYKDDRWRTNRPHSVFYFTLEASPFELNAQLKQFEWGKEYFKESLSIDAKESIIGGLNIISVPSPADNLTVLNRHIRHTIAQNLDEIGRLVAIVIDPIGGVNIDENLPNEISELKNLADTHRTFLFLLAEDYVYKQNGSIEHFAQSIIHMEHDPSIQPYRRLHIQKARGQRFRAGYHQLDLIPNYGIRVLPSVEAQSAYAHEQMDKPNEKSDDLNDSLGEGFFIKGSIDSEVSDDTFLQNLKLGSVLFLMGPPGTFKQHMATHFSMASGKDAALYISFKAEFDTVEQYTKRLNKQHIEGSRNHRKVESLKLASAHVKEHINSSLKPNCTTFIDARNPLSTPEEILSLTRRVIQTKHKETGGFTGFKRAVIWGLRRLADMPNFEGGKAVQFLEALVTLLRSKNITSLLVDWPDIQRASTLPIVDLSQYILLTRVCKSIKSPDTGLSSELGSELEGMWQKKNGGTPEHIAFLRVQRSAEGFHRDMGAVFTKIGNKVKIEVAEKKHFEKLWLNFGQGWEQDPSIRH